MWPFHYSHEAKVRYSYICVCIHKYLELVMDHKKSPDPISDSTCPKIMPWVLPDPSPLCMLRRMVISETEEK